MKRFLSAAVDCGDHMCGPCPAQDADEHMRYCGVFRRPLPGTEPSRLSECIEAERKHRGEAAWREATRDPRVLWESCPRGDLLIRFAEHAGVEQWRIASAACGCVSQATRRLLGTEDERRVKRAVDAAWGYAHGRASVETARDAAQACISRAQQMPSGGPCRLLWAAWYASQYLTEPLPSGVERRDTSGVSDAIMSTAYVGEALGDTAETHRWTAEIVRERLSWRDVQDALVAGWRRGLGDAIGEDVTDVERRTKS